MQAGNTVRSILLCGASVRSLAESAIAVGLRPLCVDFFEDDDLTKLLSRGRGRFVGRIESFDDLPEVTHSVRSSIPLLWAGGLENHTNVLRVVSARRRLIGTDPDIVDLVRDPVQLHSWLTDAGLSVPRLATDSTAFADCQWLRKPFKGAGGLGIRRHETSKPRQLGSRARSQISMAGEVSAVPRNSSGTQQREYLQEYIDGVPMSAVCSVVTGQLQLFGMSLQLTGWPSLGASGFLFCGNVGPVDPGDDVRRQVMSAAKIIAAQTGLTGVFGIDFILRQGRTWFLEVNPRLTASHMLFEHQNPGQLVREHLEASGVSPVTRRGAHTLAVGPPSVTARLIIWAQSDFKVRGDPESSIIPMAKAFARVTDVPGAGTVIRQGNPICSLLVTAGSITAVGELLAALESRRAAVNGVSWRNVAEQCRLLEQRFEKNISSKECGRKGDVRRDVGDT